MFVGRHARSLDRKGRLAIPAEYLNRLDPGEREEIYVTPGENGCIWLLPKGYYSAVAAKVEEDDDDEIADLFFHYSQLRTIDKAGRLLLDEGAREFADLPDPSGDDKVSVMVCGSGRYLQVWEQTDYLSRVKGGRAFAKSLRRIRKKAEESLK